MSLDNIDFKEPEALNQEMGEAVMSAMFGDGDPTETDNQEESLATENTEAIETQETEDIPNASIRLDKMKAQRDVERNKAIELERQLSEMRGKLSVLEKSDNAEVSENDPTEYMDDIQKALFNENKALKDTMSKMAKAVEKLQVESTTKNLQEQEDRFLDNNPDLKKNKDEFVDNMLGYLENKPAIKNMFRDGQITLQEIYGMYSSTMPKSKKTSKVSNPDKVFSGASDTGSVNKSDDFENQRIRKQAEKILGNPNSTNKGEAVRFLQKDITDSIISELGI